jgi:hypothetical protein
MVLERGRRSKGKMPDDTAGFRKTGKGTESWRHMAALAGMAATWKKTPEKLAPRGSGCREYDRQALHKEFSHELK